MTKVGLLSDTHGFVDPAVYKHFKDCDEIWHAGDIGHVQVIDDLSQFKTLRAVYGNIDGHVVRSAVPEDLVFEIDGIKIFMTHIGGSPGRYNLRVKSLMQRYKPNIFICGHSHILKVMYDQQMNHLHINPGAAGNHGFHHVKTLIRFDLHQGKPANMEVIELGKRAQL
ncbi:MAG: metallophosphoesterase family protein [Bacteroidia bacterium]|jgi:putative phosphoesterase